MCIYFFFKDLKKKTVQIKTDVPDPDQLGKKLLSCSLKVNTGVDEIGKENYNTLNKSVFMVQIDTL